MFPSSAQTVAPQRFSISGYSAFDSATVYNAAKIAYAQSNQAFRDSLVNRLRVLYQNNGYFQSEVKDSHSVAGSRPDTVITINVIEHQPAYIKSISVIPSDSLLPQLAVHALAGLPGKKFSIAAIEDLIKITLNAFQNTGYPFAALTINRIAYEADSNFVHVWLGVQPGGQFRIEKMVLTGKTDIRPEIVMRELRFQPGMLYDQNWVDKIPQRLNRMKLFDAVGNPGFSLSAKNEGVLHIPLQDKNNNSFDGVIGYIPSTKEGEKGYLTGFLDIAFRNIFGTARAATFLWKKLNSLSSELDFSYMEPWVLNFPFNITIHLNQTKQDSTYVSWNFEPSIEYIASEELSLSIHAGYGRVIPTILDMPVFTVYNATKRYYGFAIRYDTRDDPFVPMSGLLFQNSYTFTAKQINGPVEYVTPDLKTSVKQQNEVFDFHAFLSLSRLNVFTIGIHGRLVDGDVIELADLFKLGGANSLRGYRENQFLGQRIAWSNVEYRIILEKRTYAFAFFDLGFIDPGSGVTATGGQTAITKNGYGIGLNFQTGLGMMNVSFAIAGGESFSQGVIHFGLKNEF
jgi:outer membrane protein insertion porin family